MNDIGRINQALIHTAPIQQQPIDLQAIASFAYNNPEFEFDLHSSVADLGYWYSKIMLGMDAAYSSMGSVFCLDQTGQLLRFAYPDSLIKLYTSVCLNKSRTGKTAVLTGSEIFTKLSEIGY